MIQATLDARRLTEVGKMLGLPLDRVDENYLVHCALGELFGDDAPKPFSVEGRSEDGRRLRVLGYATKSDESLERAANTYASPAIHKACNWDEFDSKPMPTSFAPGTRLGFELHACPVQRMSSDGPKWSEGSEVDAFLVECWEVDDEDVDVDRGDVYESWLKGYFERRGGASVERATMKTFSLEKFFRRTQGSDRKGVTFTRPATTLAGELEVTDSETFAEILRGGIGRHKAFGFGMLKLRRPGR
jgi:CRISPR system Cascade subunit CasE